MKLTQLAQFEVHFGFFRRCEPSRIKGLRAWKWPFRRVVTTLGVDERSSVWVSSNRAIRATEYPLPAGFFPKCSDDFSAKVLIWLERMVDSAQVGLTRLSQLDHGFGNFAPARWR